MTLLFEGHTPSCQNKKSAKQKFVYHLRWGAAKLWENKYPPLVDKIPKCNFLLLEDIL